MTFRLKKRRNLSDSDFLKVAEMDLKYFLCVIGLVLVIEGLPYFAFAGKIKGWLRQVLQIPDSALRIFGFMAMLAGLFLIYLGRS